MSGDTIIIHFDKLCRTCMNESDEMTSLFKAEFPDNVRVVDVLATCAFLQVREDDGLPSQICLECYTKIQQAHNFRTQCQKSDELIRSYLSTDNAQNVKIVKLESMIEECHADYIGQDVLPSEYTPLNEAAIEELAIKMEAEYDLSAPSKEYDEQYESCEELEGGADTCVGAGDNSCPKCAKTFEQEELLSAHVRHCEIHECGECKKKFRSAGYLMKHLKKHNPSYVPDEKRFKCKECDKAYTSPANLRIHQYSHSGIKPYKCQYCGRGFTKTVSLNSHLALHTGKRTHLCAECGRGFTSTSILNQHKKIHSGERPFKCPECERSFTASGDLTIHMRSHTGEKPYLCPTCGQMFARITHLNTHIRTHTGERPYVCRSCGRGFAQSGDLRSHERTHTGERPYVCHICNKKFVQNSGLSSHMATHSAVKSHVCHICNRAFSQSSSLARHVKAHAQ